MASLADFPLGDDEVLLDDEAEVVWRQCAPAYFDERTQRPTDLMFRATAEDKGKLSGARGTKSSAASAYQHRTEVMKKQSKGTWGVTVGDITGAGSRAVDDSALLPKPPPPPPPGHTYIDVRAIETEDKQARQRFRSTLLISANKRGRAHPA